MLMASIKFEEPQVTRKALPAFSSGEKKKSFKIIFHLIVSSTVDFFFVKGKEDIKKRAVKIFYLPCYSILSACILHLPAETHEK